MGRGAVNVIFREVEVAKHEVRAAESVDAPFGLNVLPELAVFQSIVRSVDV